MGGTYQLAWHGTAARGIEKEGFKLERIGTGEGIQAYGWGIYFAQNKGVAESYRESLAGPQSTWEVVSYKGKALTNEYREQLYKTGSEAERVLLGDGYDKPSYNSDLTIQEYLERSRAEQVVGLQEISRRLQGATDAGVVEHLRGVQGTLRRGIANLDEVLPHLEDRAGGRGQLYRVDLPENKELLDLDKPFAEQPEKVQAALREI